MLSELEVLAGRADQLADLLAQIRGAEAELDGDQLARTAISQRPRSSTSVTPT